MEERGIIIADKDDSYRKELAEFFEKAGYSVETTDSAIHVLCNVLEKQTPVLLLGTDFDKKVSSEDLIHLLKKCNRTLSIIVVSDNMTLAKARQIRSEGIFYHALRPSDSGDTGEIDLAVKCAFDKLASGKGEGGQFPKREEQLPAEEPEEAGTAIDSRTLQPIIILTALVLGMSYLSLLAGKWISEGDTLAIWLFLGFCALIITSQLLPVFRIRLRFGSNRNHTIRQEDLSQDGE